MNKQLSMLPRVKTRQHGPGALDPHTPQQKRLFQELHRTYAALGRRAPRRFATIQQAEAYQTAAEELGDEYNELLLMSLQAGRTSMAGVLRYLQACVRSRKETASDDSEPNVVKMPWTD